MDPRFATFCLPLFYFSYLNQTAFDFCFTLGLIEEKRCLLVEKMNTYQSFLARISIVAFHECRKSRVLPLEGLNRTKQKVAKRGPTPEKLI